MTIWLTGLSGAGKTTLAEKFIEKHNGWIMLDGDILREEDGLCADLGFEIGDRRENIRRVRALCRLLNMNGINVIASFISPIEEDRVIAKKMLRNCVVVWIKSSLSKCEERDVKGLYKMARGGYIPFLTGINSPFDEPKCADLVIDTENSSIELSYKLLESLC